MSTFWQGILDFIEQEGISLTKLSTLSNVDRDRMYQWKAGNGNPKGEDSEKLQKWKEQYLKSKKQDGTTSVMPEGLSNSELYTLLIKNATSLEAALKAHSELVAAHSELAKANSDLAASNRTLSEAAKSHIQQSQSVRQDGDTIIAPDTEKQKDDLRNLLSEKLNKKTGTDENTQRNGGQKKR